MDCLPLAWHVSVHVPSLPYASDAVDNRHVVAWHHQQQLLHRHPHPMLVSHACCSHLEQSHQHPLAWLHYIQQPPQPWQHSHLEQVSQLLVELTVHWSLAYKVDTTLMEDSRHTLKEHQGSHHTWTAEDHIADFLGRTLGLVGLFVAAVVEDGIVAAAADTDVVAVDVVASLHHVVVAVASVVVAYSAFVAAVVVAVAAASCPLHRMIVVAVVDRDA